jgi:hypothetical protein
MTRIHFNQPTLRILIALIVLGGFALALYWMGRLPGPSEANRVNVGDDLFSIIKPPDWEQEIFFGPPGTITLKLQAAKSVGRPQTINVSRIAAPITQQLEAMDPWEFQGQKAWLEYKTLKWEYLWRTIFQRGTYWYELELHLQLKEDVPRSEWWPYVMSFRAGNGATTAPTPAAQSLRPVSPVATTLPSGIGNVP